MRMSVGLHAEQSRCKRGTSDDPIMEILQMPMLALRKGIETRRMNENRCSNRSGD